MSLSLLPSLAVVPPPQEILEFEISSVGYKRPVLSPTSSSSSGSAHSRKAYRPSLTAADFRMHAFGSLPRALDVTNGPAGSGMRSSSALSSERTSVLGLAPSSTSVHDYYRRSSLPSPPPRGTFCSATMSHCSSLPIAELDPFQQVHDLPTFLSEGLHPMQEYDRTAIREPLMSSDQWREKAEWRLERRELRRLRVALDEAGLGVQPLPLCIDCRPMEGSMAFPPSDNQLRISRVKRKFTSVVPLKIPGRGNHQRTRTQILGEEELDAINASLNRSKLIADSCEITDTENQRLAINVDDDDSTLN
ncbi:hypothetical protein EW145_g4370 [Phellinidium pouzarii]|uniref:Uncharacterized protein n=1 Tax=Phellinidium pouzarii TaxID=167371 RepID=A0A4S4L570_9AGAM|nr:hypothetical protein EW145_g4370 [Phellinidium pouzarii]